MALVKYNNNSISAVTATAIPSGSLVPIKTLTASSSATLSFVHGTDGVVLDSTYPIYKFEFINIHPATGSYFEFNLSTDSGANYNVTKTSTFFNAVHNESDSVAILTYRTGDDLAQSTAYQHLRGGYTGNLSDECISGFLTLFNPSSTTYVKHFISRSNNTESDYCADSFLAGYGNTTSAIDAIQFKFSSGNIDAGKIKLYGIKDS